MKIPLPICTLSALAACTLSGQGGSRVYGEIKARDLCVTAPILLSVLPALVEPSVLASSLARWQALHSIGFLFLLRLVVQARVVRFALKRTVNRCSLFILSIF